MFFKHYNALLFASCWNIKVHEKLLFLFLKIELNVFISAYSFQTFSFYGNLIMYLRAVLVLCILVKIPIFSGLCSLYKNSD